MCWYQSCQVIACCHCVCKCYFLLQVSLQCREILRVACQSLKESKHAATADCFPLLLFNSCFKCSKSKSSFCWRMPGPAGKLTAWGLKVNVLIEWNAVKLKLMVETVQTQFLTWWTAVKLSAVTQMITVSPQKGSQTPCAAVAQVLQVSHSVPGLLGGFL
jgi:hypothetical protein